ncbi:MAG: hemerythrin domain-containing protein [bacterium]
MMCKKNTIFVLPDMKAADIILNNPYLMILLEHFEINFEMREKSVKQICKEKNINLDLFLTLANLFNGHTTDNKSNYSFEEIKTIIVFLKKSHQNYLEEKYPKIELCLKKMLELNDHPQVLMAEKFFCEYYNEVKEHFNYENKVVFPYVISLHSIINNGQPNLLEGSYSVAEYKEHHDNIEEKLEDLKSLLIKYLPVKNDQIIRRELLFGLFSLEYDLNIHAQIEDNILIPLVELMEQHIKHLK